MVKDVFTMLLWSLALIALCFVQGSKGQCQITGDFDIVWLLDASIDMEMADDGDFPFQDLQRLVVAFSKLTSMGSSAVRQTFVQFSGPVDSSLVSDSSIYTTVGSYLIFENDASLMQTLFEQEVQL